MFSIIRRVISSPRNAPLEKHSLYGRYAREEDRGSTGVEQPSPGADSPITPVLTRDVDGEARARRSPESVCPRVGSDWGGKRGGERREEGDKIQRCARVERVKNTARIRTEASSAIQNRLQFHTEIYQLHTHKTVTYTPVVTLGSLPHLETCRLRCQTPGPCGSPVPRRG